MGVERVFILGAGPAGLSISFNLSAQGKNVTVIEKEAICGGMAITFKHKGCHFDLGPHTVHTAHMDVLAFLKKILGNDLIKRTLKIHIYFNGKFVNYPLKGVRVLTVLPFWHACLATLNFFWARLLMFLRDPKEERSFKAWITNRFGRVLYNIYFGPYAEKAWKIPASQISSYVAKKRVPTLSLTDYIRTLFKKKPKAFHSEDVNCVEVFYPRHGVGQVSQFLEKETIKNGGHIWTETLPVKIHLKKNRLVSISLKKEGATKTHPLDFLFSTIPINNLIELIDPPPPEDVRIAAQSLDYCSERLLYILVNKEEVFEAALLYFQNPAIRFNRVYGVRKLGPECVPEGKEALIVEFTCTMNDAIWNATDKELFDEAMQVFTSIGALKAEEVETYFTKNVTHAYPRFRLDFAKHLKTLFDYLTGIDNLTVLGRQGLFCYANVDEVISMGFKALEIYPSLKWKPIDYRQLFKDFIHVDP